MSKSYTLKKITPNLIYKSLKQKFNLMWYYKQTGGAMFNIYDSLRAELPTHSILNEIISTSTGNGWEAKEKAKEKLICAIFGESVLSAYDKLLRKVMEHIQLNYSDSVDTIKENSVEDYLDYYLSEIFVSEVFMETLQDLDYDIDCNVLSERQMKQINAQFKRNLKYAIENKLL